MNNLNFYSQRERKRKRKSKLKCLIFQSIIACFACLAWFHWSACFPQKQILAIPAPSPSPSLRTVRSFTTAASKLITGLQHRTLRQTLTLADHPHPHPHLHPLTPPSVPQATGNRPLDHPSIRPSIRLSTPLPAAVWISLLEVFLPHSLSNSA